MSSYRTELDDFMGGRRFDEFDGPLPSSRSPSAPADMAPPEPQAGKKRKAEKEPEANKKPKVMENKAIWISNLPPDTTKEELEEEFSRYGMIDKGANGEPRIRLEEKEGRFTGNAMIVYFKKEAIVNAVKLADDYPLRLGETEHGNIHVEPASMEYKKEKDGEKVASKLTRRDRKATERNRQELNRKLNEWSDNEDEVAKTFVAKKNKWAKVVIIKGMFDVNVMRTDPDNYDHVYEDTMEPAAKFGTVTKVTIWDLEPEGIVTVRFKEFEDAEAFVANNFGGRKYNGSHPQLSLAEDKPRFKKSGRGDIFGSESE